MLGVSKLLLLEKVLLNIAPRRLAEVATIIFLVRLPGTKTRNARRIAAGRKRRMAQNGLTELRAMECSVAEDSPVQQPGDELSSAIATKLAQHGATETLLGVPAHLNTYFALPDWKALDAVKRTCSQAWSSSGLLIPSGRSLASREAFLEAFDAASLQVSNRLFGQMATCRAEAGLLEVAPWNRREGYLGYLTQRQEVVLQQLTLAFPQSKTFHTPHDLLRFLRAHDFDLEKTRKAYSRYITEYREKLMVTPNPLVRATLGPFPLELISVYPERDQELTARMERFKNTFLDAMAFGTDQQGCPVVYMRPANLLRRGVGRHVPLEDRLAFQSAANEAAHFLLMAASQKAGHHLESIVQVIDMDGVNSKQMMGHTRSAESQQELQHNQDFHPEMISKVFVINAPAGVSMAYKLSSRFLPAALKRRMEVHGTGYGDKLAAHIGRQNMPSCYGGAVPFEWPELLPFEASDWPSIT